MAWASCSDISIRYALSGRGKLTLVLLHELGGSLESWDGLMPALDPHFRILRYDQRAAGLSEKVRMPFSMQDHADDLIALIRRLELKPPYYLCAVAAGAAIALTAAQRLDHDIAAIVLCSPAMRVDPARKKLLEERSESAMRHGMRSVMATSLARSYPPAVIHDNDAYLDYQGRFLSNDPVGYALANRALAEVNLEDAISQLSCRCLLLGGTHDLVRPVAEIKALAARMRWASFEEVESGHLMSLQAPQAIAERLLDLIPRD